MQKKGVLKLSCLLYSQQALAHSRQLLSTMAALVLRITSFVFVLLFSSLQISAQFTVTLKLQSVPAKQAKDMIYVAGSFNKWDPALDEYKFSSNNILTLSLSSGQYEFKFTRGSWEKVECTKTGNDIANHSVQINSDTSFIFSIEEWKDNFLSTKKHTASGRVRLVSEEFAMPLLKKKRHIWVYLPGGYEKSTARYPVMYMNDGQNVFDEYLAPYGEWGVDECLDSLIAQNKPACIVVAIETGGMDRMSEYNPYNFTWKRENDSITFEPKAEEYLNDVINTVKPYIDKKFRTLTSNENTIIAGSSMGGLISYYAAIKYPEVFGKAGIFSPAFWTASGIDDLTDSIGNNIKGKYFFYMGGKEGEDDLQRMIKIKEKVGAGSSAMIYSIIDPDGQHKEEAWRKWFAEFYTWIMADGYNVNISPKN